MGHCSWTATLILLRWCCSTCAMRQGTPHVPHEWHALRRKVQFYGLSQFVSVINVRPRLTILRHDTAAHAYDVQSNVWHRPPSLPVVPGGFTCTLTAWGGHVLALVRRKRRLYLNVLTPTSLKWETVSDLRDASFARFVHTDKRLKGWSWHARAMGKGRGSRKSRGGWALAYMLLRTTLSPSAREADVAYSAEVLLQRAAMGVTARHEARAERSWGHVVAG